MTMLMLTLGQAARMCGRGKTTLARAIKGGKLSAMRNETGGYLIDPAELSRAFPFPAPGETRGNGHDTDDEVHRATAELHERAVVAEREVSLLREQMSEVRRDRDRWHAIAEERLTKVLEARPPAPATPAPMSWWSWLRSTG